MTSKQKKRKKNSENTEKPTVNRAGDLQAKKHRIDNDKYEKELARLQIELVKLQELGQARRFKGCRDL